MSAPNSWNYLPSNVLQNIFSQLNNVTDPRRAQYSRHQCQLVSRRWYADAQKMLYKNVYLSTDAVAPFSATLHNTRKTTQLGRLVKNVDFDPDPMLHPNRLITFRILSKADHYIDTILRYSPNIQKFGSSSAARFESKYLWKRLLEAPQFQSKQLQVFSMSNWTVQDRSLYYVLALKFIDSLKMLRVVSSDSIRAMAKYDGPFFSVLRNLDKFRSLERLQISTSKSPASILGDIDILVNRCCQTVRILELQECCLSIDHRIMTNRNANITHLELKDTRLSVSAIYYFQHKLVNLQSLVLNTSAPDPCVSQTKDQYNEWWDLLIQSCLRLQHFDINISSFDPVQHLFQIIGAALLQGKKAIHNKRQKKPFKNEFILSMIDPDVKEQDYIIKLHQQGSSVRLFDTRVSSAFLNSVNFTEIFLLLHYVSPNVVKILNVEHVLHYDNLFHDYEVNSVPGKGFNESLAEWCNARNWAIFNGVTRLIEKEATSEVHFDKMIFVAPSPTGNRQVAQNSSITKLTLSRSFIHPQAFLEMSRRLPNIDTLIIDSCTFTSDNPHRLDINLSETRLNRVILRLNRMFYQGSLRPNIFCHTAFVETGKHTSKSSVYQGMEGYVTTQDITNAAAVEGNFLITFKCKELQCLNMYYLDDVGIEQEQLIYQD